MLVTCLNSPTHLPEVLAASDGVQLRATANRGQGVFSTRHFTSGSIVMVGVIERILEHNDKHASQIGEGLFAVHAGLISMVNHSCDPNCGIRVNETGAHDYIAMRDIVAGEEIVFDYAMRNYRIDYFPERCLCGAVNCRGRISGWADLPDHLKEAYRLVSAPYLLDLDAKYSITNGRQ